MFVWFRKYILIILFLHFENTFAQYDENIDLTQSEMNTVWDDFNEGRIKRIKIAIEMCDVQEHHESSVDNHSTSPSQISSRDYNGNDNDNNKNSINEKSDNGARVQHAQEDAPGSGSSQQEQAQGQEEQQPLQQQMNDSQTNNLNRISNSGVCFVCCCYK